MTALGMREVRLADVQREIPELDAAMVVYRRLSEDGTSTPVPAPQPKPAARRAKPAKVSTPRPARPRRAAPPSFKEFALTQLDSMGSEPEQPMAPPPAPRTAFA